MDKDERMRSRKDTIWKLGVGRSTTEPHLETSGAGKAAEIEEWYCSKQTPQRQSELH